MEERTQLKAPKNPVEMQLRKEIVATIIPSTNEFAERKGDGWKKSKATEEEKKEGGVC